MVVLLTILGTIFLIVSAIFWFEDIEKLSSNLTSGNVSHQGAIIRNKAIRCSTFIQEFCKTKEE